MMRLLEVKQLAKAVDDTVDASHADLILTLPFEVRQKSRFRAHCIIRSDSNQSSVNQNEIEVGVMLPRGQVLRDGDVLQAIDGQLILVQAADESVSEVHTKDPRLLSRVCYHLGNRHVPLQIGNDFARYVHDHVLDDMVTALGLNVTQNQAPFEPEAGAYGHGHSHRQQNEHSHEHLDENRHGHSHD